MLRNKTAFQLETWLALLVTPTSIHKGLQKVSRISSINRRSPYRVAISKPVVAKETPEGILPGLPSRLCGEQSLARDSDRGGYSCLFTSKFSLGLIASLACLAIVD